MAPIGRVALLGPAPPDRGGIARETALLAAELSKRAAVSYFTFSRRYPRWLDPRRFDRGPDAAAPVEPRPRPVLDYLRPSSWSRTARAIASVEPDAVIVPWWTAFWALPVASVFSRLAASRSAPNVLLCHNVDEHASGGFRRLLAQRAFESADAFVVHAESDRARLEGRVSGRPVALLPHPVVSRPLPDRDAARRALGIDGPLVLFLGLIRRYKGVDLLLDAAPRIVGETGARIAIVGEVFPEARSVERSWRSSPVRDAILWRDEYVPEDEMERWLAACDGVVLPYAYVSGSGIAARAIAARRPMAAAAVGGLTETVVPGATGELFTPADPDALAAAVARVLDRGIESYEPGLARAAENASWPRYVDRFLAFLASVEPRRRAR